MQKTPKVIYKTIQRGVFNQLHINPGQGVSLSIYIFSSLIFSSLCLHILRTEKSMYHYNDYIIMFDYIFAIAFAVEFILRFWSYTILPKYQGVKGKIRFLFNYWRIVDFLCLASFYIAYFTNNEGYSIFWLRSIELLRVVRVLKLPRLQLAYNIFMTSIRRSLAELTIALIFVLLFLLLAATLLYLIESDVQPEKFGSIPRALWWAVITLTTVGYGDVYPITAFGRMVAGFVSIVGIGIVAMPTSILVSSMYRDIANYKNKR